jgi:thioredoxin 1
MLAQCRHLYIDSAVTHGMIIDNKRAAYNYECTNRGNTMGVRNIPSGEEFKKAIERGVTLVDFSAPWCAPCRFQKSIISKLAHQFKGKVLVASMNIHEHQNVAMKLGIQCVPTMVIFKNSKEIQRFVGLHSESAISDALKNLLK